MGQWKKGGVYERERRTTKRVGATTGIVVGVRLNGEVLGNGFLGRLRYYPPLEGVLLHSLGR